MSSGAFPAASFVSTWSCTSSSAAGQPPLPPLLRVLKYQPFGIDNAVRECEHGPSGFAAQPFGGLGCFRRPRDRRSLPGVPTVTGQPCIGCLRFGLADLLGGVDERSFGSSV
jgi:hypothetical protein